MTRTAAAFAFSLLLAAAAVPAAAVEPPPSPETAALPSPPADPAPAAGETEAKVEFVTEFDPYYTAVSVDIPLTTAAIPEIEGADEAHVYRTLFAHSLHPRFLMLEAAVFPMPLAGVYIRSNHRGFYDDAAVSNGVNLVEAVTAGFQEPYALTLFLGDVVSFVKPGELRKGANKGYMGWMFSFADRHIKHNRLIEDKSLEIEWKMKGDKVYDDERLNWSFRLGTKFHDNPDIATIVYLGLRRSNCDFRSGFLSWMKNSSFDLKLEFAARDFSPVRQEFIVGKKFPLGSYKVAFRLDTGVIWDNDRKYSGRLRDREAQSLTLVLRPNVEF